MNEVTFDIRKIRILKDDEYAYFKKGEIINAVVLEKIEKKVYAVFFKKEKEGSNLVSITVTNDLGNELIEFELIDDFEPYQELEFVSKEKYDGVLDIIKKIIKLL